MGERHAATKNEFFFSVRTCVEPVCCATVVFFKFFFWVFSARESSRMAALPFITRLTGLPPRRAAFLVCSSAALGAAMEFFMIKVWIKDTNFYSVVVRKEAERRAAEPDGPAGIGELVRRQWEERQSKDAG